MTLWCVEKYAPRAVIMCFGQESADYRVEAYPAYHAARPEMPDDLAWQWERSGDLYRALGWDVQGHESLEADDLMGSLAAVETEAGGETLILTADRDMFQCANEHVTILLQRARQQGPDEVGPDGVREIYGIDPEQVPDFIALRGDPSDGLPGAKGIGAKTAADLLRRKGDLEHVILGAIRETPSVRKALIEQAAELRTFRDIATLRSIPVERPPDAPTDYAGGSEKAAEIGMGRLSKRPLGGRRLEPPVRRYRRSGLRPPAHDNPPRRAASRATQRHDLALLRREPHDSAREELAAAVDDLDLEPPGRGPVEAHPHAAAWSQLQRRLRDRRGPALEDLAERQHAPRRRRRRRGRRGGRGNGNRCGRRGRR